jgi:hypothetical protein
MDITGALEQSLKRDQITAILRDIESLKEKGFKGTAKILTSVWPPEEGMKETVEIVLELRKEIPLEDCNLG